MNVEFFEPEPIDMRVLRNPSLRQYPTALLGCLLCAQRYKAQ